MLPELLMALLGFILDEEELLKRFSPGGPPQLEPPQPPGFPGPTFPFPGPNVDVTPLPPHRPAGGLRGLLGNGTLTPRPTGGVTPLPLTSPGTDPVVPMAPGVGAAFGFEPQQVRQTDAFNEGMGPLAVSQPARRRKRSGRTTVSAKGPLGNTLGKTGVGSKGFGKSGI